MKKEQMDALCYLAVFVFCHVKMRFPFSVCMEIAQRSLYDSRG